MGRSRATVKGLNALAAGAALIALAALAGCGDDSPPRFGSTGITTTATAPAPVVGPEVDRAAVRVVRDWADTLRRGDVDGAARLFAVPSVVANSAPPERLTTGAAIREFNRGLPCGARLVRADAAPHGFVIATFVLTERPGPGTCGTGNGNTARTAFRVRAGHITDWLRIEDLPEVDTTTA